MSRTPRVEVVAAALLLLGTVLVAGRPARADEGILFLHVTDAADRALAGVQVGPAGKGGTTVTDGMGRGRIRLPPEVRSAQEIELQVAAGAGAAAWVFISPWNHRVRVPPFAGSEAVNLVLVHPGDRQHLLASVSGRKALEKSVLSRIAGRSTEDGIGEEQRRRVLREQAAKYGLTPEELDRTIRERGTKSSDLEEQGLAALYEKNYPLATRHLTAELARNEKDLTHATARTVDTAFFLAQSLRGEGRNRDAVVALQRADALRPHDRGILVGLGWALLEAGRFAEARQTFERAAWPEIRSATFSSLGDLDADTGLASALDALGDFAGARKLRERMLADRRRAFGPADPETLAAMGDLATTLIHQGDLPGARKLQEDVLAGRRRLLGPNHRNTLSAMNDLANTFTAQGDLAGALRLQQDVVAGRRRLLGPDHPHTLSAMNNLGVTLVNQHKLPEARKLQEEVVAVRRRILGPEHPETLTSMSNLAHTLRDQGDLAGARKLLQAVLDARRRVLGPDHPDTFSAMSNLAGTFQDRKDLPRARQLEEQALAGRLRLFGPRHPDVTASQWNLLVMDVRLDDAKAGEALIQQLDWLLTADEGSLSGAQKRVRGYLRLAHAKARDR